MIDSGEFLADPEATTDQKRAAFDAMRGVFRDLVTTPGSDTEYGNISNEISTDNGDIVFPLTESGCRIFYPTRLVYGELRFAVVDRDEDQDAEIHRFSVVFREGGDEGAMSVVRRYDIEAATEPVVAPAAARKNTLFVSGDQLVAEKSSMIAQSDIAKIMKLSEKTHVDT